MDRCAQRNGAEQGQKGSNAERPAGSGCNGAEKVDGHADQQPPDCLTALLQDPGRAAPYQQWNRLNCGDPKRQTDRPIERERIEDEQHRCKAGQAETDKGAIAQRRFDGPRLVKGFGSVCHDLWISTAETVPYRANMRIGSA